MRSRRALSILPAMNELYSYKQSRAGGDNAAREPRRVPGYFPLRILREQKGISQMALAAKLGIERTRLVRLEKRPWKETCLGDLEMFASGLGMRLEEVMSRLSAVVTEQPLARTHVETPYFSVDSGKGYRFNSLIAKPSGCFAGVLRLNPCATLPFAQAPRADFIFYYVLENNLLLTLSGKEYRLRENECFTLDSSRPYEFYNPHQVRPSAVLVFCSPSLVQLGERG